MRLKENHLVLLNSAVSTHPGAYQFPMLFEKCWYSKEAICGFHKTVEIDASFAVNLDRPT